MDPGPARIHVVGCGAGAGDGAPLDAAAVGGKAHGLMRLARLGVRVPPAVVLDTAWCRAYEEAGGSLPTDTAPRLEAALRYVEAASGRAFGGARRPLLVSVRSGAPVSMPGMMETVLNVGLCDATLPGLVRATGNPRLAWDCYRRLVEAYAETVAVVPMDAFAAATARALAVAGVDRVGELDFREQRALVRVHLEQYERLAGEPFPQTPREQLLRAVAAVLRSWRGPKARWYRAAHGIPDDPGTAVIVQQMVFGNGSDESGAGVGFTRDPSTGEARLYVDYARNSQGEDVVGGRSALAEPERALPDELFESLLRLAALLEREFRDAQEFEFTVEDGELYVLQVRDAKRTPLAALRIAVELAEQGLVPDAVALARIADLAPEAFEIEVAVDGRRIAAGTGASGGVATGAVAVDPADARARAGAGESVILVRDDVATADVEAIAGVAGLLTRRGARTSHAAVVARQLGKPCVVGCADLAIDANGVTLAGERFRAGERITIDGGDGAVYAGSVRRERRRPVDLLQRVEMLRRRLAAHGSADAARSE